MTRPPAPSALSSTLTSSIVPLVRREARRGHHQQTGLARRRLRGMPSGRIGIGQIEHTISGEIAIGQRLDQTLRPSRPRSVEGPPSGSDTRPSFPMSFTRPGRSATSDAAVRKKMEGKAAGETSRERDDVVGGDDGWVAARVSAPPRLEWARNRRWRCCRAQAPTPAGAMAAGAESPAAPERARVQGPARPGRRQEAPGRRCFIILPDSTYFRTSGLPYFPTFLLVRRLPAPGVDWRRPFPSPGPAS